MTVYVVLHAHYLDEDENIEDIKLIGIYSSRENAGAAIERLKLQPGFCDTPEGFHIDEYSIDEDHWAEGYVTMRF